MFRSARRRACDERAFVLTAVGIDSEIELDGDAYVVWVDAVARAHATHHLWQYEQERLVVRPPEPVMTLQPHAWWGAVVYAIVLLLVPLAVAQLWFSQDFYAVGVMDPERIRGGEWWRAWTALTLHWDPPHLLGNLGAGGLLGFSAAQVWGNARAWLLIVTAAAVANLLEAVMAQSHYLSAGASTGVFAALGLIAAYTWRMRRVHAQGSMRRWVPLVAGVTVLALFGAGDAQAEAGNHTNVLSHALGFIVGAVLGVVVATGWGGRLLARTAPWLATALALGPVLGAWALALRGP
ncbi:MAG: rhomboid family intramembrane serine protease [Steroidobacteraceae bacterium]